MAEIKIEAPLTPLTATLVGLSTSLDIEIDVLMVLYEEYGKDIFLFFSMLAGKTIRVPSNSTLRVMIESSKEMIKDLDSYEPKTVKATKTLSAIKNMVDGGKIVVRKEI